MNVRRILPHQTYAALCHRRGQCDAPRGTSGGSRHHRPRHGQSRPATSAACDRQAVRSRGQARCARLFAVEGYSRPAPRPGKLLPAPFRGRARSRTGSGRHDGLERGPVLDGDGHQRAGRCDPCPEPGLSDPHLRLHDRRGDDPQRADDAGRTLLARARQCDGLYGAAPHRAGVQLSQQSDGRDGRSRILRTAGGLGEEKRGLGAVRPRLFRALL